MFLKNRNFDQQLIFKKWKKGPTDENLRALSPRNFQNKILNEIFNPEINTITVFFPESRHFFQISKKGQERPPAFPQLVLPLVFPVHGTAGQIWSIKYYHALSLLIAFNCTSMVLRVNSSCTLSFMSCILIIICSVLKVLGYGS